MPYFPLVVVFCRRYVSSAGIGTLIAIMLPYALAFLLGWTLLLLGYWALGLPLGLQPATCTRIRDDWVETVQCRTAIDLDTLQGLRKTAFYR